MHGVFSHKVQKRHDDYTQKAKDCKDQKSCKSEKGVHFMLNVGCHLYAAELAGLLHWSSLISIFFLKLTAHRITRLPQVVRCQKALVVLLP
jgi:hypothetical protein